MVPVGTTGESPTLTPDEKDRLIRDAVALSAGRVLVIAGTGSNDTATSVQATRAAAAAGANACLLVTPYYNKPSPAGMLAHVTAVAAVGLPIVLYNVPGRAGVTMPVSTILALAKLPEVVALKDATGNVDNTSEVVAGVAAAGLELDVLSGDDSLTLPAMSVGAVGVVSVLSNLTPRRVVALVDAAAGGRMADARALHLALFPLAKVLFIESNPVPVKRALELAGGGLCGAGVRLPLVGLTPSSDAALQAVLAVTPL